MSRRDSAGRKIGFNWWREYNNQLLFIATAVWEAEAEAVTLGYETEMREYEVEHPRPTLKEFLTGNAGMRGERNV